MTQIMKIINDLQDTDLTIERLLTLAQTSPNDDIAQFNIETIKKRRFDLERKLSKG